MASRKPTTTRRPTKPRAALDAEYRRELEEKKQLSTLQLLFRASRLLDEAALARVAALPGRPKLRRSHTALFAHIDLEGTRVSDLAARAGVSKQAISQLVDELEAEGVLARVEDPADGRARRVTFTPRGRAGLLDGLAVLVAFEAELGERIGVERMAALREGLVAVLALLDRRDATSDAR